MRPASTTHAGAIRARLRGMETTVVATTKSVTCASPVQELTAKTAPPRSRQKATAAESAPKASSGASPALHTANTPASDRTQLSPDHARKMRPASGNRSRNASPEAGSGGGEPAGVTPAEAALFE